MKKITEATIEQIAKALGRELTGSEITSMLENLSLYDFDNDRRVSNPNLTNTTKWRRINESIIAKIRDVYGNHAPLWNVIQYVANPARYIKQPGQWRNLRQSINEILIFNSYELGDDGLINQVSAANTMTEALERTQSLSNRLTPLKLDRRVMMFCREELLREDYFHAIFEASKGLMSRIQSLSGLQLDGTPLIEKSFSLRAPILFLRNNRLQTADERDMYFAISALLKTIVYMYRNPQAHHPKLYDEKNIDDAVSAFVMISKAHRILDNVMDVRGWDE